VNSELVKESFDEYSYNFLKRIIIPSARADETNMDYSFGIFLGYNVELTDDEKRLSNSDFRTTIREKIKQNIISSISSINNQIKKQEFIGYQFYVYIIPFSDLDEKRKEIIKNITE
jgi:hypothetical protein